MATNPQKLLVGAGSFETDAGTTSGNFADTGGFRDSLSIRFSEERFNLEVADHLAYVKSARTRLDCFINTSFVEATFANLMIATGTHATAHTGLPAASVTSIPITAHDPGSYAVRFAGTGVGSTATWDVSSYIFSTVVPTTDSEISYQKDGETLIPASFMVLGTVSGATTTLGIAQRAITF